MIEAKGHRITPRGSDCVGPVLDYGRLGAALAAHLRSPGTPIPRPHRACFYEFAERAALLQSGSLESRPTTAIHPEKRMPIPKTASKKPRAHVT